MITKFNVMLSFKLSRNLNYWVNLWIVEGRIYKIMFSLKPLGMVDENIYSIMIQRLVYGEINWWEVPHFPLSGVNGELLRFLAKKVVRGKVASYSSLGREFGLNGRKVAHILKRNRLPLIYPCHRVVYADGRIGGYFSQDLKKWLLSIEGVKIIDEKIPKEYFIKI